jgi:hypothetical protein
MARMDDMDAEEQRAKSKSIGPRIYRFHFPARLGREQDIICEEKLLHISEMPYGSTDRGKGTIPVGLLEVLP